MNSFKHLYNLVNWPAVEAIGTWLAALGTLLAVYLALRFARRDVAARHVERGGEIIAMISEASSAGARMRTLIREGIPAPLYRLPSAITTRSLPKLIGDGQLTPQEIDLLVEFSNKIDEINRGLERAGDAHAAHPEGASEWLKQEHRRNIAKATEVVEVDTAQGRTTPLLDETLAALFRAEKKLRTKALTRITQIADAFNNLCPKSQQLMSHSFAAHGISGVDVSYLCQFVI